MYAVIQTGGKQYKVQPGDIIGVEKLEGEPGTAVQFSEVLFCSKPAVDAAAQSQVWVGTPFLNGATVQTEIVGQGRGDKILIVKMKRRKQYRRTQGHRQYLTEILVTAVDNGAGETAALSATEKKSRMAMFFTNLKPKGPASTPKTLGSRKRMAEKAAAAKAEAAPAAKAKKAAAKSTTAARA